MGTSAPLFLFGGGKGNGRAAQTAALVKAGPWRGIRPLRSHRPLPSSRATEGRRLPGTNLGRDLRSTCLAPVFLASHNHSSVPKDCHS